MSVRASTRTFFATCVVFLGLFAFSFLPVLTQGQGDGNGGDTKHEGQIDGHLEGAPPVAGAVCVNHDGNFTGLDDCDQLIDKERSAGSNDRQGGFSITVDKQHIGTATFRVLAGPNVDEDASTISDKYDELNIGHDQIGNRPCKNLPLDGAGMALCQNPDADQTQRFNVYWTDRADEDGNNEGGEKEGDDGTQ